MTAVTVAFAVQFAPFDGADTGAGVVGATGDPAVRVTFETVRSPHPASKTIRGKHTVM